MDRREFLLMPALAALIRRRSFSLPFLADASNPDPLAAALRGSAAFSASGGDHTKVLRTWQALLQVYRRTSRPLTTDAEAEQIAQDVRVIITNGNALDAEAYAGLADFLTATSPGTDSVAHAAGLGLNTISPFVAMVSPPLGVATGIAGVWAEDGLKYLAQPGLNLSVSLLPPADTTSLALLNEYTFQQLAGLYDHNPRFQTTIRSQAIANALGIRLDAPAQDLFEQLPEAVRSALRPLINQSGDLARNQAVMSAAINGVVAQFGKLNTEFERFRLEQTRRWTAEGNEQRLQETARDLQRAKSEMQGAANVGAFLIGHVFGDQQAARVFGTVCDAGIKVYEATRLFNLGALGTFGLLGAVAAGLGAIVNVLFGGPSTNQLLIEGFKRVGEQIQALGEHLDKRLNHIEVLQRQTLDRLDELYAQVIAGQVQATDNFVALARQSSDIVIAIDRTERESQLGRFDANVTSCQRFLATSPRPAFENSGVQREYRAYLDAFFHHAYTTSRMTAFAGPSIEPGPSFFPEFANALRSRKRLEMIMGLTPAVFAVVGQPVPAEAIGDPRDATSAGNPLGNFVEWARGTQAYLETRTATRDVDSARTNEDLLKLWRLGLRFRAIVMALGSPETRHAASHLLSYHTDLWRVLYKMVEEWEKGNLLRFDYDSARNDGFLDQPAFDNRRVYVADGIRAVKTLDPMAEALARRLITKTETGRSTASGITQITYRVEVLPAADRTTFEVFERTFSDTHRVEIGGVSPSRRRFSFDYLVALVRKYGEYPTKRFELGRWLAAKVMEPSDEIDRFETVAGAARVCLCAAYLCASDFEADYLIDLRTAPILSTRDELATLILRWTSDETFVDSIRLDPSGLASYGLFTTSVVFSSLNPPDSLEGAIRSGLDTLNKTVSLAFGGSVRFEKGPRLIDETLRRLAGVMTARGLSIPTPPVPLGSDALNRIRQRDAIHKLIDAARTAFHDIIGLNGVSKLTGMEYPSPWIAPNWSKPTITVSDRNAADAYLSVSAGLAVDADDWRAQVDDILGDLMTVPDAQFTARALDSRSFDQSSVVIDAVDAKTNVRVVVTNAYDTSNDWAWLTAYILSPASKFVPSRTMPEGMVRPLDQQAAALARQRARVAYTEISEGGGPAQSPFEARMKGLTVTARNTNKGRGAAKKTKDNGHDAK